MTTWVTFVPCFFWIFLGRPYVERLRGNRTLTSALSTITAAVVGVVLNLAVWFSIHTLFEQVGDWTLPLVEFTRPDGTLVSWLRVQLPSPEWGTLNLTAAAIAAVAFALTFYFKRGMTVTLAVCAVLGIVATLLG